MDPLTQGILGASVSQASAFNKARLAQISIITLIGFLCGLSPDLDVLIKSDSDPLLFLEYHRHFSHSLIFIPFGSFVLAMLFQLVFAYGLFKESWALGFKELYLYCLLAFATHAILDATTSYGTQLFWPFSDVRISWNNMSIIDPLYTIPIVIFVVLGAAFKKRPYAYLAVFWIFFYPTIGVIQRERAESQARALAESRGHFRISSLSVKPSFGNLLVWKSIYEVGDTFFVDAIRVGISSKAKVYSGQSIAKLPDKETLRTLYPWLEPESQQARDIERFRWFSQGYVAQSPTNPLAIIDVRYSAVPNEIAPLWSIVLEVSASKDVHVRYLESMNREDPAMWQRFFSMLKGEE